MVILEFLLKTGLWTGIDDLHRLLIVVSIEDNVEFVHVVNDFPYTFRFGLTPRQVSTFVDTAGIAGEQGAGLLLHTRARDIFTCSRLDPKVFGGEAPSFDFSFERIYLDLDGDALVAKIYPREHGGDFGSCQSQHAIPVKIKPVFLF